MVINAAAGGGVEKLPLAWESFANLELSIAFGAAMAITAMLRKRHNGEDGSFRHGLIASIFTRGMSVYIASVFCVAYTISFFGTYAPSTTDLISLGFGEERIKILFAILLCEGLLKLYEAILWVPPRS